VLRDLTRARTVITRERTKEIQRLEKLLEDAGIKLSAVASNIVGVSGRAMLEALIAGERDILGLWAGDGGEGAKFWLAVLTEIKNRGTTDVRGPARSSRRGR